MTLIAPESWDDVQLFLEDGGYRSLFQSPDYQDEGKEPFLQKCFMGNVIRTIRSNPEQLRWLQAWMQIASISDVSESLDNGFYAFFETVWHLYKNNVPEATRVLERYQRDGLPTYPQHAGIDEYYFTKDTADNGMHDFIDVPSGLRNRRGEVRLSSPLSSISDDSSDDNKKRKFVGKNQDVFSSVSPTLLNRISPGNSYDNSSPQLSVNPERTRSRPGLRSRKPINYDESLRKKRVSLRHEKPVKRSDTEESESEPEHGVITVAKRQGKLQESPERKLAAPVLEDEQHSANTLRISQRHTSHQSGGRYETTKLRDTRHPKRWSPHALPSKDTSAESPTGRASSLQSEKIEKTPQTKQKGSEAQVKSPQGSRVGRGDEMIFEPATMTDTPRKGTVVGSPEYSSTRTVHTRGPNEHSRANEEPPTSQTSVGVDMDLDHMESNPSEKRTYSQVFEETPDSPMLGQEAPSKKPRIYGDPTVDETRHRSPGIDTTMSPPMRLPLSQSPDIFPPATVVVPAEHSGSGTVDTSMHGEPSGANDEPPTCQTDNEVDVNLEGATSNLLQKRSRCQVLVETPDAPRSEQEPPLNRTCQDPPVDGTQPRAPGLEIAIDPPIFSSLSKASGLGLPAWYSYDSKCDSIAKILCGVNNNHPLTANLEPPDSTPHMSSPFDSDENIEPPSTVPDSHPTMNTTSKNLTNPLCLRSAASKDNTESTSSTVSLGLDEQMETPDTVPPMTPKVVRRDGVLYDPPPYLPDEAMPTTPTSVPRPDIIHGTPQTQVGYSPRIEDESISSEPPWRHIIDPPTPPNSARNPGESDTHSWHIPRAPSAPLLCFPRQSSQVDEETRSKKPTLPMVPPVWAQSRQELCESLPYFRSYQGGVYSRGKKALGYLLDGHPAAQDLWHAEGRLIVSHAGGNSAVDKDTRRTMLVNDQTESSVSCAALLNSYKCGQPIVLIAGNEYNLFPYDLEQRCYVVLGYYLITQAWEEPERSSTSPRGYFVRWKFLFQWIDAQGEPWWIQRSVPGDVSFASPPYQPSPGKDFAAESKRSCSGCNGSSPHIFNFGWVCTMSTCHLFFMPESDIIEFQEGYSPSFLAGRAKCTGFEANRLQIRPSPLARSGQFEDRETTTRRFWGGFHCGKCGKLSCREHWTHWECSNCHEIQHTKHVKRVPGDVTLPTGRIGIQIGANSGIKTEYRRVDTPGRNHSFRCRKFILPFNRGVIHLIEGNPSANIAADEIFQQYQRDAEDPSFFRRYCMKAHKLKGRMLSHYFSQNSGEPYKYVGGTDNTVPLDTYASVKQAIILIRERTSFVLEQDPLFNEILSAAYMNDQKMEFHSDGEKDLGSVVASLSLGAPAMMRFRAVPTRFKLDPFEASDTHVRKKPPVIVTLTLRHGDVLVMEGAGIQEYYQHAVHPSGFRIAATARYIKTEKSSDKPEVISEAPSQDSLRPTEGDDGGKTL